MLSFVIDVRRNSVGNNLMQADLSVWGMYHHADIVVKVVMIGLILASVVTGYLLRQGRRNVVQQASPQA